MNEFRFADPQLVHWLWAVLAAVALLLWLDQRGGNALDRLVSPLLQSRLVNRPGVGRRRMRIVLLGLAGVCLVAALMRPQWGLRQVAVQRAGAEIMIALDVSRSMLAEDVAPNRLERAKAEIVDLLAYLRGDQVGLIAFAGRASVLAPLTPDFGFLRLVLDGVGPDSVQRGGTKLEEPIRKAIAGFGEGDGAARLLLLITDGEDHDSFPLDAAKAAAEAGIVIIAIGFGDEAGSEIAITDARTGVRSLVRDADGRPVRSRLDGDLLRELALATGGAYVPAGTGVLDLESIYQQYVARLTRGALDPRGKIVRDEGYQWFVLLGLVFLFASVLTSGRSGRAASAAAAVPPPTALIPLVLLALQLGALLGSPNDAVAQPTPPHPTAQTQPDPGKQAPSPPDTAPASPAEPTEAAAEETTRELYNRGVAALTEREFDRAEALIGRARREARADSELRFHATYDLGWLAFQQAGRIEAEAPRDALALLYRAADWFRDAAGQRKDDPDSRVNLEVTLRRALLLADQLAKDGDTGIEGTLEGLVTRERELLGQLAQLHTKVAVESDPNATDRLRGEFRGLAAAQRTILSDADHLARQIGEEESGLQARPEDERTPEDEMRTAQLGNVMHYLHRARERMGQTRSQLRQRQSERAYRRASASLGELKRALDQLHQPVKVLDGLLRDANSIAEMTARLRSLQRELAGAAIDLPTWLTPEALKEDQASLAGRTGELAARLRAGLDSDTPPQSQEQADLLLAVVEAQPFVGAAAEHFLQAASDLGDENLAGAALGQLQGLQELSEARERFLDLEGLIEAAYADEARIAAVLSARNEEVVAARAEYLPSLRAAQHKNRERGDRLAAKIAAELQKIQNAAAAPGPDGAPPDPEAMAQQVQRMEVAAQLAAGALDAMDSVREELGADSSAVLSDGWSRAAEAAVITLSQLEELRRLFFSIAQLVRELAERQTNLADVTQDALALAADPDRDGSALAAPLAGAQADLAARTLQIANALVQQADAPAPAGQQGAEDAQRAAEAAEKLRTAAEHVVVAQGEMEDASAALSPSAAKDLASATAAGAGPASAAGTASGLASAPGANATSGSTGPAFLTAREHQDQALVELTQALELLTPPQQPGEPGDQGDQGNQGEQADQGDPGEEPPPQASPQADPSQLLQGVRDREAQRRRERGAQGPTGYDTVEKDW